MNIRNNLDNNDLQVISGFNLCTVLYLPHKLHNCPLYCCTLPFLRIFKCLDMSFLLWKMSTLLQFGQSDLHASI